MVVLGRKKQLAPAGAWRTWGFLTGRGFGKQSISIAEHINDEVEAGRAMLIGLAAQDEQSSVDIEVNGPSGLIATAPPWHRPQWEAGGIATRLAERAPKRMSVRRRCPARSEALNITCLGYPSCNRGRTRPGKRRFLTSFFQPASGNGRIVWDASPKRRHPIPKRAARALRGRARACVLEIVPGTTHENSATLGDGYVAEMQKKFGGTMRGREELLGEMLTDSELALVKQAWIDAARRPAPATFRAAGRLRSTPR